jgi:hypothetical protein
MNDKRFLKVKKAGEERYFRNVRELWRFCEKQEGITLDKALKSEILIRNNCEWVRMHFPDSGFEKEQELFVSGGFLFQAFYGNFSRTSGDYTINILAVQREGNLSMNDLRNLIPLESLN